jgi:hypothetical protein
MIILEVETIYIGFPLHCFHKDGNVQGLHFHPFIKTLKLSQRLH